MSSGQLPNYWKGSAAPVAGSAATTVEVTSTRETIFAKCHILCYLILMSVSLIAKQVAESIEGVASALADDFSLRDVWEASVGASWVDAASVPPLWQSSLDKLAAGERKVLSHALYTPAFSLGIATVGLMRQLPSRELLRANQIGPSRVVILKAFGHYTDREVVLEDVIGPPVSEEAILREGSEEAALIVAKQRVLTPPPKKRLREPQTSKVRLRDGSNPDILSF
jgi:hypothetical protein